MANNVTIKDANDTDRVIRTIDVSDVHYQVMVPHTSSRSDAYTAGTTNGTAVDTNLVPVSRFTLQAIPAGGTPTAWVIKVMGSLDGSTYDEVARHSSELGDQLNQLKMIVLASPVGYFRTRCESITLNGATNITMYVTGAA